MLKILQKGERGFILKTYFVYLHLKMINLISWYNIFCWIDIDLENI